MNPLDLIQKMKSTKPEVKSIEKTVIEQVKSSKLAKVYKTEIFSGVYDDDLNILELDETVKEKLAKSDDQAKIQRRIDKLAQDIQRPQSIIDRKESLRQLSELRTQKANLDTCLETYVSATRAIIEAYRELGPRPKVISFGGKTRVEIDPNSHRRHMIIRQYLEQANKFVALDFVRNNNQAHRCAGCGYDLKDLFCEEDGGLVCPECGVEEFKLQTSSVSVQEAGTTVRNNYETRSTFEKAFYSFQGRQTVSIPPALYRALDQYFASYGFPSAETVKELPPLSDGTKMGTSREMMFRALSDARSEEVKCADYYVDINLICHEYWGWVLPDLSHLHDQIMQDHDRAEEIYQTMEHDRQSSISAQYKLFQILRRYIKCSVDDFKIAVTSETRQFYDECWSYISMKLGWEFQGIS